MENNSNDTDSITPLGNGLFRISANGLVIVTTQEGLDELNQAILDAVRNETPEKTCDLETSNVNIKIATKTVECAEYDGIECLTEPDGTKIYTQK